MTRATQNKMPEASDDMQPEYDFSGGVRGKHAKAMQAGYTMTIYNPDGTMTVKEVKPRKGVVIIEPDVLAYFPDSDAVNDALRTLIHLVEKPHKRRARKHEPSPNHVGDR